MDKIAEIARSFQVDRLRRSIEKRAGLWSSFRGALTGPRFGETVGNTLLEGAAGAAVSATGTMLEKGFTSISNRIRKPRAFKEMVDANPSLKKMDQKRVQQTFNTLYTLNPQLARDPLTAGSFVNSTVHRADVGGSTTPHIDLRTATELQRGGADRKGGGMFEAFRTAKGKSPTSPKPETDWGSMAAMKKYEAQLRRASQAKGRPSWPKAPEFSAQKK
jgi:hypothetical protein